MASPIEIKRAKTAGFINKSGCNKNQRAHTCTSLKYGQNIKRPLNTIQRQRPITLLRLKFNFCYYFIPVLHAYRKFAAAPSHPTTLRRARALSRIASMRLLSLASDFCSTLSCRILSHRIVVLVAHTRAKFKKKKTKLQLAFVHARKK